MKHSDIRVLNLDFLKLGVYAPISFFVYWMTLGMSIAESTTLPVERCYEIGRTCACANLRRAARVVTQLYDECLRPTGLRVTQFALLMAAKALGPATVKTLARKTTVDRTTLARNLAVLEKKGFVSIQPGQDLREREVDITHEGLEMLLTALPYWEIAQRQMAERLGESELRAFVSDLSKLVSAVRG
jgi:DNA-binding MarR family transcriptional regulator